MSEEVKSNENLPIRQNLVDTAVGFLLNPSVKQRPADAKIAFLKQKGLTDSEIDEAFSRVQFEPGTAVVSNENRQLVNAYPLPPHRTPNPFWFHLSSFSSSFVSFAVAVYVLHRFYKSYIEPWLFGSKSEMSEMAALKEQLMELNNSVSRLSSTVSSLEEAVNNQMHQIDRTSLYGVESVPKSVNNILDEVSNVKSLLLNRFSFPAPPALAGATESKIQNGESKVPPKVATIPKWQLRSSEDGKSKGNSKEQIDESEDKEKSSGKSSPENSLSSEDQTRDQENNLKNTKDKIQDEDSKSVISKGCLEHNLNAKSKIQKEDSEALENINGKALDGDSGAESPYSYSDCESVDQTSESILTKNSE